MWYVFHLHIGPFILEEFDDHYSAIGKEPLQWYPLNIIYAEVLGG